MAPTNQPGKCTTINFGAFSFTDITGRRGRSQALRSYLSDLSAYRSDNSIRELQVIILTRGKILAAPLLVDSALPYTGVHQVLGFRAPLLSLV